MSLREGILASALAVIIIEVAVILSVVLGQDQTICVVDTYVCEAVVREPARYPDLYEVCKAR